MAEIRFAMEMMINTLLLNCRRFFSISFSLLLGWFVFGKHHQEPQVRFLSSTPSPCLWLVDSTEEDANNICGKTAFATICRWKTFLALEKRRGAVSKQLNFFPPSSSQAEANAATMFSTITCILAIVHKVREEHTKEFTWTNLSSKRRPRALNMMKKLRRWLVLGCLSTTHLAPGQVDLFLKKICFLKGGSRKFFLFFHIREALMEKKR